MNLALNEKIRLKLESFDHKLLDLSCKQIIDSINTTQAKVVGPMCPGDIQMVDMFGRGGTWCKRTTLNAF